MRRAASTYLFVAVAFAVTLVLLVVTTAPPSQDNDPSSRAAGKAGTLALYRWLGDLGFRVHRISGRFDVSGTDVLVIADPRDPISDGDAASVMAALARGVDLVLAVSPDSEGAAAPLLARLRIELGAARDAGDSVPAQPIDVAGRVHRVPMAAGSVIEPAPYLTPLLIEAGALTGVAEQINGAGRAYLLTSAFPLSNDGLRDADSSTLVLSMLERARGGAIGFDEYHHGEIDTTADGAVALFESPVGLALLLGVVVVVAFLALNGRRLGAPLPTRDDALVPSTASYIDAMAGLYARTGDRAAVAARYADDLKRRLAVTDSWGPDSQTDQAFLDALQASRPDIATDAAAVLRRARALAAGRPDAAALLALARDVDDLEHRWMQPAAAATAQ